MIAADPRGAGNGGHLTVLFPRPEIRPRLQGGFYRQIECHLHGIAQRPLAKGTPIRAWVTRNCLECGEIDLHRPALPWPGLASR